MSTNSNLEVLNYGFMKCEPPMLPRDMRMANCDSPSCSETGDYVASPFYSFSIVELVFILLLPEGKTAGI